MLFPHTYVYILTRLVLNTSCRGGSALAKHLFVGRFKAAAALPYCLRGVEEEHHAPVQEIRKWSGCLGSVMDVLGHFNWGFFMHCACLWVVVRPCDHVRRNRVARELPYATCCASPFHTTAGVSCGPCKASAACCPPVQVEISSHQLYPNAGCSVVGCLPLSCAGRLALVHKALCTMHSTLPPTVQYLLTNKMPESTKHWVSIPTAWVCPPRFQTSAHCAQGGWVPKACVSWWESSFSLSCDPPCMSEGAEKALTHATNIGCGRVLHCPAVCWLLLHSKSSLCIAYILY